MKHLLFLTLGVLSHAQSLPKSQAALVAATALDLASSWNMYEHNPVVGNGQFGARQALNVSLATAGVLTAESLLVKRYPRLGPVLARTNYVLVGAHGFAVTWNLYQRRSK